MKKEDIDLDHFGMYNAGLTISEIKEYLKQRAGVTKLGHLYDKFCRIAGVNTVGAGKCEFCGKMFSLMYRHDVERFVDVLLLGKKTYFD